MPLPESKSCLDQDSDQWDLFKALSLIWGPRRTDLQQPMFFWNPRRKGAERDNVLGAGEEAPSCGGGQRHRAAVVGRNIELQRWPRQEAGPAVETPDCIGEELGLGRSASVDALGRRRRADAGGK